MIDTSRYEHKYLLTIKEYYMIKFALKPFVEQDPFSTVAKNERYLVRSLYYDSLDLKAYQDRDHGIYGRIKCRIRAYSHEPNQQQPISIEIKTKRGTFQTKYNALVPSHYYDEFLLNKAFPDNHDPVLTEFARLVKTRQLRPQYLVQYYREGYISKFKEDVRITFDHEVKSARTVDLYDKDILLKNHQPAYIVLEIKYAKDEPAWLTTLIKKYSLKRESNSKYIQSVDQFKPIILK
jgi:hypothetical protein